MNDSKLVQRENSLGNVVQEPVHPLEQVLPSDCAAAEDLPVVGLDLLQLQHCPDLLHGERAGQVLLVGEYEEGGAQQPLLPQQGVQLLPTVLQPPLVCRVDHPDEAVSGLEVIPPVGPQGFLAPDVPDVELESSVVESLDIKTRTLRG